MNIEKSKKIEALCKELSDLMDSPDDCMVMMLYWFAEKFNDDYTELSSIHQDKNAGKVYEKCAKLLDKCASILWEA